MPSGEIYVGADVSNKMELGIITKSFCRATLKFAGTMVDDLHYSFGDFPDTPGDYNLMFFFSSNHGNLKM